jgi:NitT/TauT family transport system substrate-binding protein
MRKTLLAAVLLASLPAAAQAADKVKFQLSWRPQAEHGCYYQAIGTGIYAKHGLDVTVVPGGPQINTQQILVSGTVEFAMGSNSFTPLNYVNNNIPFLAIATVFQKDPQGLMTHPGVGLDTLESLKGVPTFVSGVAKSTWWNFLRVKFGFPEEQMRPYTFNLAPWLNDKKTAQQAFITNEPYQAELAGVKPNFFLFADYGYADYAYTIETSRALVEQKPDLVQRFVNASIEGCYSYLHGDPTPGNKLILEANPQMTTENLLYSIKLQRERGLVDGGDAAKLGIGAMTDERWKQFFDVMVEAGLYPATLDYKRGYSLQFVNKGYGMPKTN